MINRQQGGFWDKVEEIYNLCEEGNYFNEEIKGRVVYITPYQTRFSQTNLRVGVKFDSVDKNISIVLQLLRNKKKFFSS